MKIQKLGMDIKNFFTFIGISYFLFTNEEKQLTKKYFIASKKELIVYFVIYLIPYIIVGVGVAIAQFNIIALISTCIIVIMFLISKHFYNLQMTLWLEEDLKSQTKNEQ